jgi:hypothetical protein
MGQKIDSSETTREALNFNFSKYFNLESICTGGLELAERSRAVGPVRPRPYGPWSKGDKISASKRAFFE